MDIRIRADEPADVLRELIAHFEREEVRLRRAADLARLQKDAKDLRAQSRYAGQQAEWWRDVTVIPKEKSDDAERS